MSETQVKDMTDKELLDEFESRGGTYFRGSNTPEWKAYAALRAELLRRLTPGEPACPKCGGKDLTIWIRGFDNAVIVQCPCHVNSDEGVCNKLSDFAQFFRTPAAAPPPYRKRWNDPSRKLIDAARLLLEQSGIRDIVLRHEGQSNEQTFSSVMAFFAANLAPAAAPVPAEPPQKEPVLCYVSGDTAYFTTHNLAEQWGDDWNDAPYEHNAGSPYEPHKGHDYKEGEPIPWHIVEVKFEGPFERPCDGHTNSPYSVQQINAGATAWLRADRWAASFVAISAGTPLSAFKAKVKKAGGKIYVEEKVVAADPNSGQAGEKEKP